MNWEWKRTDDNESNIDGNGKEMGTMTNRNVLRRKNEGNQKNWNMPRQKQPEREAKKQQPEKKLEKEE